MGFRVLAFLFAPRKNIRDLIGTRPWRVVSAFSLTTGMLFCLVVAEIPAGDIPWPEQYKRLAIPLTFVATSYLSGLSLYWTGLLLSRWERQFGTRATVAELSAAMAWSTIPWLLYFALGLLTNPFLTADSKFIKNHLYLADFSIALGPISWLWGIFLIRSSLLELRKS